MIRNFIVCIFLLGFFSGCASLKDSMTIGFGTGAVAGATAGMLSGGDDHKSKRMITGALVGSAVGGLVGYFIHGALEKRDDRTRRDTLFNLDKFGSDASGGLSGDTPAALSAPVVEAQWVETQVQGKKLVEGHKVWVISEDPQWVPRGKR